MFDVLLAFVLLLIIFASGLWVGCLYVVIKLAFEFHDDLKV